MFSEMLQPEIAQQCVVGGGGRSSVQDVAHAQGLQAAALQWRPQLRWAGYLPVNTLAFIFCKPLSYLLSHFSLPVSLYGWEENSPFVAEETEAQRVSTSPDSLDAEPGLTGESRSPFLHTLPLSRLDASGCDMCTGPAGLLSAKASQKVCGIVVFWSPAFSCQDRTPSCLMVAGMPEYSRISRGWVWPPSALPSEGVGVQL